MIVDARGRPTSVPEGQKSVADLVHECQDAMRKMSRKNPHRAVLAQCIVALTELSVQLARAQTAAPRVPLIGVR